MGKIRQEGNPVVGYIGIVRKEKIIYIYLYASWCVSYDVSYIPLQQLKSTWIGNER